MLRPNACRVSAVRHRRDVLRALGAAAVALSAPGAARGQAAARFQPFSAVLPEPLSLPDLSGVERSLADLRGRPVVLHVFATWCEPCRDELPALAAFAAAPGAPPVAAVALAEPASRVRPFLDRLGVALPLTLLDDARVTVRRWGVAILPTTILIDAEGAPRWKADGPVDWSAAESRALVESLSSQKTRANAGVSVPGG